MGKKTLQRRASDERRLLEMMADFSIGEGITPDLRRLRTALGRLLREHELGRAWLILEAGELVGYAVLTFNDLEFMGRDAFLTELFVRKDLRGRGIGRRALALVERQAVQPRTQAVHLMVPEPEASGPSPLTPRPGQKHAPGDAVPDHHRQKLTPPWPRWYAGPGG